MFELITPKDIRLIIIASIFFMIVTTFFLLLACYIDSTDSRK